eukprot:jgi/Phyca11/19707/fgenesh1_pg.PHYCAscaffold_51_\
MEEQDKWLQQDKQRRYHPYHRHLLHPYPNWFMRSHQQHRHGPTRHLHQLDLLHGMTLKDDWCFRQEVLHFKQALSGTCKRDRSSRVVEVVVTAEQVVSEQQATDTAEQEERRKKRRVHFEDIGGSEAGDGAAEAKSQEQLMTATMDTATEHAEEKCEVESGRELLLTDSSVPKAEETQATTDLSLQSELETGDQEVTATEVSLDAEEKADDGAIVDEEEKKESVTIEEQKPPDGRCSKQQLSSDVWKHWKRKRHRGGNAEWINDVQQPNSKCGESMTVDALIVDRDTEDFLIGEDWMYDQGVKIDFVSGEMKWYEDNTKKVVPFTGVGAREQRERVAKIRLILTEHGNVRDLDADDR